MLLEFFAYSSLLWLVDLPGTSRVPSVLTEHRGKRTLEFAVVYVVTREVCCVAGGTSSPHTILGSQ